MAVKSRAEPAPTEAGVIERRSQSQPNQKEDGGMKKHSVTRVLAIAAVVIEPVATMGS